MDRERDLSKQVAVSLNTQQRGATGWSPFSAKLLKPHALMSFIHRSSPIFQKGELSFHLQIPANPPLMPTETHWVSPVS